MTTVEQWLVENKSKISHFRPRRWGGVESLLVYDRRQRIPYIENQPQILDTAENRALIQRIIGSGFIEDPHAGNAGSRNY